MENYSKMYETREEIALGTPSTIFLYRLFFLMVVQFFELAEPKQKENYKDISSGF